MILIVIAFTLLALVAGMYLLAKTQQEKLGGMFKWVSYLVILVCFLSLACIGAHCIKCCVHREGFYCTMGFQGHKADCCDGHMGCCRGGMMKSGCKEGMDGECSAHKECCKKDSACHKHCDGMKDDEDGDRGGKKDSTHHAK